MIYQFLVQNQNFLIFTIDGRGSENRGKEFEQIIFNELGKIEMKDQITGYNYLASLMRSPAWVFDTRSVVNRQEVEDTGVNLWKLGEGN